MKANGKHNRSSGGDSAEFGSGDDGRDDGGNAGVGEGSGSGDGSGTDGTDGRGDSVGGSGRVALGGVESEGGPSERTDATSGGASSVDDSGGDSGSGDGGTRKRRSRRGASTGAGAEQGGSEQGSGSVRSSVPVSVPESVGGKRKGRGPAKAKGTAVTLAALLQYGSGMAAYMAKMPHLEYEEQECDQIARAASDALGTMSSKKSKAVIQFLNQWSPWITFGGVMLATTLPRVQQTRAVLAERRALATRRQGTPNAVRTIRPEGSGGGTPTPLDIARADSVMGGEGGGGDGAGIPSGFEIGSRGIGVDS